MIKMKHTILIHTLCCIGLGGLLSLLLMCCTSCSEKVLDVEHPDVSLFVRQLKGGHYVAQNAEGMPALPKFTMDDIVELLRYADDLSAIPEFPLVAVSYASGGKPRLGECILWMVETIRLGHPASMGCKMVHTDADNYEGIFFLTDEEVHDAVSRYRQWWDNRQMPLSVWTIDPCRYEPLCGSRYMWW